MLEAAVVMAVVALISVVVARIALPALSNQEKTEHIRVPVEDPRRRR